MTKRESALVNCRVAGYHNDSKLFVDAYIENRISYQKAEEAWREGVRAKRNGMKCGCYNCTHTN